MMNNGEGAQTENLESSANNNAEQTPQVLDLDGVSEFKFQGETFTPNRLTEVYQGYQKYGETSKYVEEDKTYWANVFHDIDKVVKNPQRLDEFKSTYPERFWSLLDRQMGSNRQAQDSQSNNQPGVPKEFLEKFQTIEHRLQAFEQEKYQAQVEAASAKIDAILPTLLTKYELADEDKVLFEAEKLLAKGHKMTDAAWERLVREDHERTTKKADKVYQAKLKEQITKGKQGADIGPGGTTPGQAPKRARTFAEAESQMIASLKAGGAR